MALRAADVEDAGTVPDQQEQRGQKQQPEQTASSANASHDGRRPRRRRAPAAPAPWRRTELVLLGDTKGPGPLGPFVKIVVERQPLNYRKENRKPKLN